MPNQQKSLIKILCISTYPPNECGIATFSQDLVNTIERCFKESIEIKVCALCQKEAPHQYSNPVTYLLDAYDESAYENLAEKINEDTDIDIVYLQHEFGLYGGKYGDYLLRLLLNLRKPFIISFHTVLPQPDQERLKLVQVISKLAAKVVVMTQVSMEILDHTYGIPADKMIHIPHGTHLTEWRDSSKLKQQYEVGDRMILSTFGLLSSNKSVETAIEAMDSIRVYFPNALYLVLGKTHPQVIAGEGEQYRRMLEEKVAELDLGGHVRFVNKYLSLKELHEYLAMTDIYLFTSKDPNQAVSGTFVYAMGSGCPIISTPFLQARETLTDATGVLVDFNDPAQLAKATIDLLSNDSRRYNMSMNTYHTTRSSIWENVAIAYVRLFTGLAACTETVRPNLPEISLRHFHRLTDDTGMLQFAKINNPDPGSGYTLDDNARALIAMCMYHKLKRELNIIPSIRKYLDLVIFCQQTDGTFLNYIDQEKRFTTQNKQVNLDDSNTRAVWALGFLLSCHHIIPYALVSKAEKALLKTFTWMTALESPRAIAFSIKGLSFYYHMSQDEKAKELVIKLGDKLQEKYDHTQSGNWAWFEKYLTYANAVLPEAMLHAYSLSGKEAHRNTAMKSLDFLRGHVFTGKYMKVISNKGRYSVDKMPEYGEQSIDVCYTILTLDQFYKETGDGLYLQEMKTAFSWYLGNNHLNQILYNPVSGGCFDGLEENHVNQNQGAESTVCYLIARLAMEENRNTETKRNLSLFKIKSAPPRVTINNK